MTVEEYSTVRQTLEVFTQGFRRVLVGTEPERCKILSQVDVVSFLLGKFDSLPEPVKVPIDKLGLVSEGKIFHKLVAMSHKNSAVEGFRKIYRQGVTAIAIVDDNDKLVGTLSSSDVRGLKLDQLPNVLEPVLEFLRKQYPHPRISVTVTAQAGLKEVMEKFLAGKVHRVWVIDSTNRPIGVVTMTDVLKVIFDALKKELVH